MRTSAFLIRVVSLVVIVFVPAIVLAGNLNPPASAVDSSGRPVPTSTVPGSWAGRLAANDSADPCNSSRFKCVMDGSAVLDNETGLVWQRDLSGGGQVTWRQARDGCHDAVFAGRKGWRLPFIHELASLVEPGFPGGGQPALPAGHPFFGVGDSNYWSATGAHVVSGQDRITGPGYSVHFVDSAQIINMANGDTGQDSEASGTTQSTQRVWCVRRGSASRPDLEGRVE